MNIQPSDLESLPVTRDLKPVMTGSLIVGVLMLIASALGLLFRDWVYPNEELVLSFYTNDVVNIIIGLPVLFGSIYLAHRGKLTGLLLWVGGLLFVIYTYIVYTLSMPFKILYPVYPVMTLLSVYLTWMLLTSIGGEAIQETLAGKVPERISAVILFLLGAGFLLRAILGMFGEGIPRTETALNTADILLSLLWVVGAVSLWRRQAFGYQVGLGLLFQGSMLFIGLIVLMLLQPVMTDGPLSIIDVLVVAVMSLIFFIPFGLFLRGVINAEQG